MGSEEKILKDFVSEINKFGQKKVSRLSGIPINTISNWCRGKSIPTIINAQKVANAMGLEFLIFEKE